MNAALIAEEESQKADGGDVKMIPPTQDSSSEEIIILKIVSASYGPCDGQQLWTGESSNQPAAKIPYTRDVTPILRALLKLQESSSSSSDPHLVRLKAITCEETGGMKRTSIPFHALQDGWNSMNIVFGDPCPGTSKKLHIHYVILHTNTIQSRKPLPNNQALTISEAHHVTFAENEPVILRRRVTFLNQDNDDAKPPATPLQQKCTTTTTPLTPRTKRLRLATYFEIVLPFVLSFLQVPERVRSRRVCRLWRHILSGTGVAAVIDSSDPTFAFTRPFLRGLLAHSYSSLHSLRLADFQDLCPEDLHPALPNLRKLRVLDISRCHKLKDETLLSVAQHVGGTLEVLYIKGLIHATDAGVMAICQACNKLKVLEVSYIPITDKSGEAMGRLTHLRALYMRNNFKLTNQSIDTITANCKKLNQLTLWGCVKLKHLSFDAQHNGSAAASFGKLVSLNLWGCFNLRDDIAGALGSMKNLRTLIVSECHKLTDQFVMGIAQNLPQLLHLHLRYCKRLTDDSVNAIASAMKHLYSLDLSSCSKITAQSICNLIESRHETLSELRLQECRQIEIVRGPNAGNGPMVGSRREISNGQAILKSLRSPTGLLGTAQSNLSLFDLRCCGGQRTIEVPYPANDPFVRGMASLQFQQKSPGCFVRPARWNASMQARLQEQMETHSAFKLPNIHAE